MMYNVFIKYVVPVWMYFVCIFIYVVATKPIVSCGVNVYTNVCIYNVFCKTNNMERYAQY